MNFQSKNFYINAYKIFIKKYNIDIKKLNVSEFLKKIKSITDLYQEILAGYYLSKYGLNALEFFEDDFSLSNRFLKNTQEILDFFYEVKTQDYYRNIYHEFKIKKDPDEYFLEDLFAGFFIDKYEDLSKSLEEWENVKYKYIENVDVSEVTSILLNLQILPLLRNKNL